MWCASSVSQPVTDTSPVSLLQECRTAAGRSSSSCSSNSASGDAEAKAVADALLDESLRRGTADNVTCICMILAWG